MIKAIIFDCFGVIYDSRLKVFVDTCLQGGDKTVFLDHFRAYDRALITKDELTRQACELSGKSRIEVESILFSGFTLNQALIGYISELRCRYKTGLLTNIGKSTYLTLKPELEKHFDALVPSFETGIAKPDPEAYLTAARRLDVEPRQCVFVDDREEQCQAAEAVGMVSIRFESLDQFRGQLHKVLDNQKS